MQYCQLSQPASNTLQPTITAPPVEFTFVQLSSGFYGISSVYGNYFDVRATRDITIVGFCVHTFALLNEVKIYTKVGGYANHERDPTLWTLAQTQSGVLPSGFRELTDLEILSKGIPTLAGTRRAFLILSSTRSLLTQTLSPNGVGIVSKQGVTIYSGPAALARQEFSSSLGAYAS